MYFCHTENFAYGENNERSFSNPHPWSPPEQNGCCFAADILRSIFVNENFHYFIKISLKLVLKVQSVSFRNAGVPSNPSRIIGGSELAVKCAKCFWT